jgi:hypothetical protein
VKSYLTKKQIIEVIKARKFDFDNHQFDFFLKRGLLLKREGVGAGPQQHQSLFSRQNIDIIEAILEAKATGAESMKSIVKRFKNNRENMDLEFDVSKLAKLCNIDFKDNNFWIVWGKNDDSQLTLRNRLAYVFWENKNDYSALLTICLIAGLEHDKVTDKLLNTEKAEVLARKETEKTAFYIEIDNERIRRENTPIKEDIFFINNYYENIGEEAGINKNV